MEFADRAFFARVVCICAPVLVDPCYGQTRNQFLALPDIHGGVSVCDGVRRFVDYLSDRHGAVQLTVCTALSMILWSVSRCWSVRDTPCYRSDREACGAICSRV